MKLTHEFTVPASVEETWSTFNDIDSVAGCFPGATVTAVEGDSFTGSCKVKVGPIALVYNGSGTFTDKDESAGVMKIKALGKDKRGNGTAGADVVATMTSVGEAETRVEVVTDLNITGKPAQFGRGVMQDISDKLLGQFVECLQTKVGADSGSTDSADSTGEPGAAAGVGASKGTESVGGARKAVASGDGSVGEASPSSGAPSTGEQPTGEQPTVDSPGRHVGTAASPTKKAPGPRPAANDDVLDLGAAAVPILLKTYGKQLAAGLGALILVIWLVRRFSGR